MISEKIRMANVTSAAAMVTDAWPKTTWAWAPTPAAPKVWAMVLRLKMAASGRSMSCLSRRRRRPVRLPLSSSTAIWAGVMLKSAASRMEHKNETPTARNRYRASKAIKPPLLSCFWHCSQVKRRLACRIRLRAACSERATMKPVTVSFQPRMNIEQIEIREHLRSREPFSFLDDAELEQVARSVQVSYFRAGSTVVARGARFEELHYIRSGSVEVMGRAGELQNRMGEGQIFGQLGILSGRPARHEARAEEDTLIYFIPAGVFESLLDSNADFADHVEIEERQRLRQAVERGTGKHPLLTLKAGRLVRTAPLLISASTPVQEAARRMNEQHSSAVLVYRDSHAEEREEQGGAADAKAHKPGQEEIRLAGILTDSDFRRRVVAGGLPGSTPVGEIMTGDIVGIQADQYLFEALLLMLRSDIHHLPVQLGR